MPREKVTGDVQPAARPGLPRTITRKFHPATDLGDLMAKYAQLPHF